MAIRKAATPPPKAEPKAPKAAKPTHHCVNGHLCAGIDIMGHGRDTEGHGCNIGPNGYTHPDLDLPVQTEPKY